MTKPTKISPDLFLAQLGDPLDVAQQQQLKLWLSKLTNPNRGKLSHIPPEYLYPLFAKAISLSPVHDLNTLVNDIFHSYRIHKKTNAEKRADSGVRANSYMAIRASLLELNEEIKSLRLINKVLTTTVDEMQNDKARLIHEAELARANTFEAQYHRVREDLETLHKATKTTHLKELLSILVQLPPPPAGADVLVWYAQQLQPLVQDRFENVQDQLS